MMVVPSKGVRLSGLIFDAGRVASPVLLTLGSRGGDAGASGDPDLLWDTDFRIGGAEAGSATVSFVDNADNSVLDNVWAWRADHGASAADVGWTVNRGSTGLVVNGDDVNAYGLFVEHYQKDEVIWNGQGGTAVFFQNEMPYDPPEQAAWEEERGTEGYPAFLVSANVSTFRGYGMGSYCFFERADTPGEPQPVVQAAYAFQSPRRQGIHWADLLTVSIDGTGVIKHIIDSTGAATTTGTASSPATVPVNLVRYP
jgi:hypothetical protein